MINAFFLSVNFKNRVAHYHASVSSFPVQGDELNEALVKVPCCLTLLGNDLLICADVYRRFGASL